MHGASLPTDFAYTGKAGKKGVPMFEKAIRFVRHGKPR
jgi:hypothetical protein